MSPLETSVTKTMLILVNRERKKHGRRKLRSDPTLRHCAQWKADDMARHHYISHNERNGDPWYKKIERVFKGTPIGENLADGFISPLATLRAWKGSPDHWHNIMENEYFVTGIGFSAKGKYWCQEFGGRP